jgi:hypothetical protein
MSWQPAAVEAMCKIIHQETWKWQGAEAKQRMRNRMAAALRAALPLIEVTPGMLVEGRKQTFKDMTGPHLGPSVENTFNVMLTHCAKEKTP